MTSVTLPNNPVWHRLVPLLLVLLGACVLLPPIAWVPRLGAAIVIPLIGVLSWDRYRRHTPHALRLVNDHGLQVAHENLVWLDVANVRLGIVRPWLVTAILIDAEGTRWPLFVPSSAITESEHWQLRRMLIAMRPLNDADETAVMR